MPQAELRDQIANRFEGWCRRGGPLDLGAPEATWRLHVVAGTDPHAIRYSPSRLRVHHAIVERFMAAGDGIAREGRAAVVTAGPPGAGKSTGLIRLGYDASWRRVDADEFKTALIEHDVRQGRIEVPRAVAGVTLADGRPVMPMELSGLYHHESTAVADRARLACLATRENVIIEGTLSWRPVVAQLVRDLRAHDYAKLDVVLVETPLGVALENALRRWWAGRQTAGLGGRYTPSSVIRGMYASGNPREAATACADNARHLVDAGRDADLAATLLVV